MKKNKEEHPFNQIKEILNEDLNHKISQIENSLKKSQKIEHESIIDQINHEGGLEKLIHSYFFEDYKKMLQFINKKIFVSALISFCFLCALLILTQFFLTTSIFRKIDQNTSLTAELTDSVELLNPNPKLNSFLLIIEAKPLPVKLVKNNLLISSYDLKDYFEIFYLLYKCQVDLKKLNFKLPVDLFNNISEDDFSDFSLYFNYEVLNVRLDQNFKISLQGTTEYLDPQVALIFKKFLGNSIQIEYEKFKLKNIYFESGSTQLDQKNRNYLIQLSLFLNKVKNQNLIISGHADNIGDNRTNKKLSCQRAETVEDFLIQNKVSASRLKIECFSNFQTIDSLKNKNRRVSLGWAD